MKKGFTVIACVLDRSGSMRQVAEDSIGGFNTFLEDQKKLDGEAKVSVVLFDHEYEVLHDFVDLKDVPTLDSETYVPRGMTALLDAVGRTVDDIGDKLKKMKEKDRPENVVFVILTDGYENQSVEYKVEQIKNMIDHQQDKYNWSFVFLGANQDAFSAATSFGIKDQFVSNYTGDSMGTKHAYGAMSASVGAIRCCATKGFSTQDWMDKNKSEDSDDDSKTDSTSK